MITCSNEIVCGIVYWLLGMDFVVIAGFVGAGINELRKRPWR